MFPEGRILDFLIVGAVALVVVGPKDLPILMRKVGQFLAKMRAMAAEFRASFDELARQSELDELRREVEAMRAGRPLEAVVASDAPTQTVFDDIHAGLKEAGAQLHPPMSYQSPVVPPAASPPGPASEAADVAKPAARPRAPRKPRATKATKAGTTS